MPFPGMPCGPFQKLVKSSWSRLQTQSKREEIQFTNSPTKALTKMLTRVATPPACYRSLSGPSGPKCPRSVPRRVSRECPGHLFDTPGTLSGHFLDTPEAGARRAPETPRGTLQDTSGPKGPRDSCSRSGGLQHESVHENAGTFPGSARFSFLPGQAWGGLLLFWAVHPRGVSLA